MVTVIDSVFLFRGVQLLDLFCADQPGKDDGRCSFKPLCFVQKFTFFFVKQAFHLQDRVQVWTVW